MSEQYHVMQVVAVLQELRNPGNMGICIDFLEKGDTNGH